MSTSPPPISQKVFQDYHPTPGVHDEFVLASGKSRRHLTTFLDSLNQIGRDEFIRRWQRAQHTVHENGFAYGGYVTPDGNARPWELDAIPLLIDAAEWKFVSAALQQRARLLNLVLRDLYGEQTLLKNGVLPADLVFSHPGFLRSFHGQKLPGDCFLHFYAADLARSNDGKWWVLADRTEAPSGVGYALENRIVISRMLPSIFQQCQVQRLAPFFITARETLKSLAPGRRENPRVVLLSHGPTSPNYFEDAYLARYLGYTLAEGGDLAVRNRRVMLKTLGGLLPVDVILRRQNSNECDPLELDANSGKGIAGLMEAVRSGNVGIANGPGSGLVESAAFMAFMPQLCQTLLGEKLLMPGVASWWCGHPAALEHVLKNLDKMTIQPAFRNRGADGARREVLSQMTPEQLADTIQADPTSYVGQEKVARSSVPIWNQKPVSANLALRAYLVASGDLLESGDLEAQGDSYQVMPGGLARTSTSLDPLELSIRRGEGSKDTWVLSDGPVEHVTLLDAPGQQVELRRSGAELPSRTADNLFWMGRHLERADASARVLRGAANRMTGETRATSDQELPVLLRCLADQGQIEPGYAVDKIRPQLPPIEQVLSTFVFDTSQNNPVCLRGVLDRLFRLGLIERNRVSLDTWRIVHRVDEKFQPSRRGKTNLSDLVALLDELITDLAAFSGIIRDSMTRTQAYRFLELGRRLESSIQIITFLKNCFIPMPAVPGPVLETVLEVADSLMTYRSRYMANLQLAPVLDLLLTDETNPRSLAHQFLHLANHVDRLPRESSQTEYSPEQRVAMTLLHSVRMIDIQALAEAHSLGEYDLLASLCEEWESMLPKLYEAISHRYLVHAIAAHQLTDINPQ